MPKGSKRGQQEEGSTVTKSPDSPISNLPSLFVLMSGEIWGSWYSSVLPLSYTRNSPPGYPQICIALVILEVFVLKNNGKDAELLSLCPEWEVGMSFSTNNGPSSLMLLKEPKALHAFLPKVFVFYFKLFILEPQPPCL